MIARGLSVYFSGLVIFFLANIPGICCTYMNLAAFVCEPSNVAILLEEDILVDFILSDLMRISDGPLRCSQGPDNEL